MVRILVPFYVYLRFKVKGLLFSITNGTSLNNTDSDPDVILLCLIFTSL